MVLGASETKLVQRFSPAAILLVWADVEAQVFASVWHDHFLPRRQLLRQFLSEYFDAAPIQWDDYAFCKVEP